MEDFIKEVGSIYWWISVVLVGLILSVSANLITKKLDSYSSKRSKQRREEKEKREREDLDRISEIRGSDLEKILQSSNILFQEIQLIKYISLAILAILMPTFWNSQETTDIYDAIVKLFFGLMFLFAATGAYKTISKTEKERHIFTKGIEEE